MNDRMRIHGQRHPKVSDPSRFRLIVPHEDHEAVRACIADLLQHLDAQVCMGNDNLERLEVCLQKCKHLLGRGSFHEPMS
ncbi:MAG: hypothetical protein JWM56_175 [Candidatus Peribacteria bacterium]|nr:hypothetical protein [Candidatus Peribacteria bacterium]